MFLIMDLIACNVLELIRKVNEAHENYFKIMYFIYNLLHLYNYEILMKTQLPGFREPRPIFDTIIKNSASNPQGISILKTLNKKNHL